MNVKLILLGFFIFLFIAIPLSFMVIQSMHKTVVATATPIIPTNIPPAGTAVKEFSMYGSPTLQKSDIYNIYLIGDSMTHALGPRGGRFTEVISEAYPGAFFEVSNYAEAGQNIEMMEEHLYKVVTPAGDVTLKPVFDGDPQVIIIESFGYNPLSQHGLGGGLKKQNEVLTHIMQKLTERFPNTVIFFMATIAPDRDTYGRKVLKSDSQGSRLQADERIAYIKNHIKFAQDHDIPIIDVYSESLDAQGDGDTKYINPDDNIHPSAEGLELMSQVMTKRIQEENIFPQ